MAEFANVEIAEMPVFAKYAKNGDTLGGLVARLAAFISQGKVCHEDFVPTCGAILNEIGSNMDHAMLRMVVTNATDLSEALTRANLIENACTSD
jgi:hypothetical protein